jgi:hypothetical protein
MSQIIYLKCGSQLQIFRGCMTGLWVMEIMCSLVPPVPHLLIILRVLQPLVLFHAFQQNIFESPAELLLNLFSVLVCCLPNAFPSRTVCHWHCMSQRLVSFSCSYSQVMIMMEADPELFVNCNHLPFWKGLDLKPGLIGWLFHRLMLALWKLFKSSVPTQKVTVEMKNVHIVSLPAHPD